jgi:hypothetical protein
VEFDLVDSDHNAAALHGVDLFGFSGERSAAGLEQLRPGFEGGALKPPMIAEVPPDRAVGAYEAVDRGSRLVSVVKTNANRSRLHWQGKNAKGGVVLVGKVVGVRQISHIY